MPNENESRPNPNQTPPPNPNPGPPSDPPKGSPEPIPYERFAEVTRERKAALDRAAALEAELTEARGQLQTIQGTQSRMQDLEVQLKLADRLGLDQEGRDLAAFFHSRQPEDGRPDLVTWLDGMRADPTKAPRALQAYFTPPAPAEPPPPAEEPPKTTAFPSSNRGAVPVPGGNGGTLTAAQIDALRVEAERTGDFSGWKAAREQVIRSLGKP